MPACQLLSVIGGRDTFLLFEDPAEIEGVVVTDDRGYFRYIIIGAFQQTDSVINTDRQNVLHWRFCGNLFELLKEVTDAHIPGQSIFLDVNLLVVVLLEIPSGDSHFFLKVGADDWTLVQSAALDQNEYLLQVHGQK